MVGQNLGHYKIQEFLGKGGMGEVYRAEDATLGRDVALKILPPELAASQERLERFQREAKTLAALNHPNIVHVYSVEEEEGNHFLTMELVEGKLLSELIPEGGLPLEQIFEHAIPLADALATAHEKGVIHRDLKPANIMVTDEGRAMVLDFGLAKLRHEAGTPLASELPTEPLTEEGRIVGTMPYMSPEQLEGKEIDARSDIFSLAVMFYEMATGERPFKGDSSASLIAAIMTGTPREVDSLRAELPHHLGRIIRHCLEKDPSRRYQSALDVRNELDDLHREESLSAALPVTAEPDPEQTRKRSRRPLAAAAVAGAAVVLTALVALWLARSQTPTEPPTVSVAELAVAVEAQPPKIVILPFENLGDPEDDYFAAGMTEEITSRLAVVSGLGVISRNSAVRYAKTEKSIQQIGGELGVDYVLEGTVRWAKTVDGSRVRITPQLIQVSDDTHLWAETYDRVINDIFEVQSDIAGEVIRALDVTLQIDEREFLGERPTESIEAYQAYLRGIDLDNKEQREDALRMFEKAVELDPAFAQAWAMLCRGRLFYYFKGVAGSESLDEARQALDQAQTLAPEDLQVRLAHGYYIYHGLVDLDRALEEFKAIARDFPNDPEALAGKAYVLRRQGRWKESTAALLGSLALDPQNSWVMSEVGLNHFSNRQFDDALSYVNRAISLTPDDVSLYRMKLMVLLAQGSIDAARETFASASATEPMHPWWMVYYYYDRQWDEYLECAKLLPRENSLDRAQSAFDRGLALLQLGRGEGAREILQRAAEQNEVGLTGKNQETASEVAARGLINGLLGRYEDAIARLERASDLSHDPFLIAVMDEELARVYALAGEVEAAVELWDRLLATAYFPPLTVDLLRLDPLLDPLRDDPRFQALLEKYGEDGS